MAFLGSILWSKLLSPTWQSRSLWVSYDFKYPRCCNPRPANLPCNHNCACNNQVELLVRRDVDTRLIRGMEPWPWANNPPWRRSKMIWTEFLGCLGHPSLMWSSACTWVWNSSPFKPCERWQPRSRLYTCQQWFLEGGIKLAMILKLEWSCSDAPPKKKKRCAFAILCGGNFRTELEGSSKDRLLRVSSLV